MKNKISTKKITVLIIGLVVLLAGTIAVAVVITGNNAAAPINTVPEGEISMETKKEMIFTQKPTDNCHASTVLPLPDGNVLAAWFGGSNEGNDDVDIYVSLRENDQWETPRCISASPDLPHWNPVLFQRDDGVILLFFKVGKKIASWQTYICESEDGGRTWSEPQELVPGDEGGRGPVKNKPIRLSDGRILAGASLEDGRWRCFTDASFDGGMTWERSEDIGAPRKNLSRVGAIQPTLWESAPGKVHMLVRTKTGEIYRSDSDDAGQSWSDLYPTDLPSNNSGIDLVSMPDGTLLLALNPVGKNWGDRTPLSLLISHDNGVSWAELLQLEDQPGEYSYPAITQRDGKVYITYTYNREQIAYWEITLNNS